MINLKQLRSLPPRIASLTVAAVLFLVLSVPVFYVHMASAAGLQLQTRSLTLSSSANGTITQDIGGNTVTEGTGGNGQKTKHTFKFNLPTHTPANITVGSILIEYCDDPIPVDNSCSMTNIPGLNASNVASIVNQTGFSTNNFSIDNFSVLTGSPWACSGGSPGRTNCIAIKRATAASETDGSTITLAFGGGSSDYITNPTTDNTPFYARIQLYSDTAYTTKVDYGSVVGSTAQQIDITAKVKEVLNFSVGNASSLVPPTGLCTPLTTSSTTGGIALGDTNGVLSFQLAYDAHSYFRLSSNTNGGVKVYYSGDTLKNGSNQINPAGTGSSPNITSVSSTTNSSQFGLAIDSSDTQAGSGYSFTSLAAPTGSPTDYSNGAGTITTAGAAKFAFDTGSTTSPVLLASASGAVACDTGSVRYLGNISTATPAGIYTTTITYIATGTY
jgi:hypothetical protein